MTYEQGQQLQHKFTKETLWVLRVGREQVLCRTKDLREIWFYPEELEACSPVSETIVRRGASRFL